MLRMILTFSITANKTKWYIERLNVTIQDIVKEKEEEKERLNDIIAGLVVEKQKDKAEKEAMNERTANIEAMLKARF
ncbi:hypothetical protein HanXRQr2_Chr09g0405741 [Helianthus annuus]|uniref:Uncharacterized protein n=1 Tax=Helianthus annuus TaxID=4232 RepID=A0A9K3I8I4_HELAN|nr:hypothetical protein HanXRQr2_Chr09g0405741 [Helianthus annuus]